MKYNLCCIGYITLDKVVTPKKTVHMPGGTSFYFAHAIKHLSTEGFQLVTALADSEMSVVDDLRKQNIEVKVLSSARSICFENIYGEDTNERKQRVTAKADPFTVDDFSLEVIKSLAGKGLLSLDVQGYLREVQGEEVLAVDWTEKEEALKYIHILKANEHEMEMLTQCADPYDAALKLAAWGVKEVLLTLGDKGSLIYVDNRFYEIPAYPVENVADATGCGDTYMAGYLYMRNKGASYQEAGCFAAAMCSVKLQSYGPFSGTEEEVLELIGTVISQ